MTAFAVVIPACVQICCMTACSKISPADIKRARRRKVSCTLYFLTPYKLKQRVLLVLELHKIQ